MGVSVTYATVAAGVSHRRRCAERPTLLIADEPHHMGEDATWGFRRSRLLVRPVPALVLRDAVPLGQLADPVGAYDEEGVSAADYD